MPTSSLVGPQLAIQSAVGEEAFVLNEDVTSWSVVAVVTPRWSQARASPEPVSPEHQPMDETEGAANQSNSSCGRISPEYEPKDGKGVGALRAPDISIHPFSALLDWNASGPIQNAAATLGMDRRAYADSRLHANQFSWMDSGTGHPLTQAHYEQAYLDAVEASGV